MITAMVAAFAMVPGAGLRIGTSDEILHEVYFGTYDSNTVVRTASSVKLLSAVAMMSVVDDGLLSLDQPVDSVLPSFAGTPNATMTLRQIFSHTSGYPGKSNWPVLSDTTITLAQAAVTIATTIPPRSATGNTIFLRWSFDARERTNGGSCGRSIVGRSIRGTGRRTIGNDCNGL